MRSIVMSEDAHQSEHTAEADKRREWITKHACPQFSYHYRTNTKHSFTGSAGQAIISKTAAYLITDSRYWHQAEKELDENWTLIRVGMSSGPQNWVDWISVSVSSSNLKTFVIKLPCFCSSLQGHVYESRVGVDLRTVSYETASRLDPLLQAKRSRLVYPSQNLIDLIWEDKPTHSKNKIYVQPIGYTGELSLSFSPLL
jgi:Xaa-Pro aminopeptidase